MTAWRAAPGLVGVKITVTTLPVAAAGMPGESVSHGRTPISTLSPGAANGRLVAPRVELNVLAVCGIRLQAACAACGMSQENAIGTSGRIVKQIPRRPSTVRIVSPQDL